MMLLDKGYFDYDYEKVEKHVNWEDTIKSDEEVNNLLSIFGLRQKQTDDELQQFVIKEETKNGR